MQREKRDSIVRCGSGAAADDIVPFGGAVAAEVSCPLGGGDHPAECALRQAPPGARRNSQALH